MRFPASRRAVPFDLQFGMPTEVRRALIIMPARSTAAESAGVAGSYARKAIPRLESASATPNPRHVLERPVTAHPAAER